MLGFLPLANAAHFEARAKWISSQEIELKLPPGFYVSEDTRFYLLNNTLLSRNHEGLDLPYQGMRRGKAVLSTSHILPSQIDQLIRGPLRVVVLGHDKTILDSTSIQYAGLLDQLYATHEELGSRCGRSSCQLKLWAPTAESVRLFLYQNSRTPTKQAETLSMERSSLGVWSISLPARYKNSFYNFEVRVYQPLVGQIESSLTTDPYSISLSRNSERSQLVDLESSELRPADWNGLRKPLLRSFKDAIIYELHIRDFSSIDSQLPTEKRGTYLAFAEAQSRGRKHLQDLAQAGLTFVHILPFNDFGTVNEDKSKWQNYLGSSNNLQEPQTVVGGQRAEDPFNWGYDPVHYFVPDGSYSSDPDGAVRIKEVRSMIQGLNRIGLRVIQDVVFNHTYESGLSRLSVFDKIVPLYYYRLDDYGKVHNSSCCSDTASENKMMEKLMIDSVVHWARTYKIDGFRFDLMNLHSRSTMAKIRSTLQKLTLSEDGVNGSEILLYGEGWSFGSFYEQQPSEAMTLENSYNTQYGFFNDRLRDAVRGGTTNSTEKSDQGFATGLFFDFNYEPANRNTPTNLDEQRERLLHYGDVIKVGLAGNLRDFYFREHRGSTIRAGDLKFRNTGVAFAAQPIETINYVSAHDGYGLWDAVQAKAPFYSYGRYPGTASLEDRQRMHLLALSIPLLGQGIPFVESGTELLRSKNGDQDSYDSGDFFNRIDWTGQTNFWSAGLPPAWKNYNDWSFWTPRLDEPALKVNPQLIGQTHAYFKALLRLRQSSALFKLNSASEISRHLHFIDNDQQPEPGLIAMLLSNDSEEILIFFNASRTARDFQHSTLRKPWQIHPLFGEDISPILSEVVLSPLTGSIQLPGRSTVVLLLQKEN